MPAHFREILSTKDPKVHEENIGRNDHFALMKLLCESKIKDHNCVLNFWEHDELRHELRLEVTEADVLMQASG